MRVVLNVILFLIPPAAIAFPLWATFRWDLPVALAMTSVSLAWAYCLGLVLLTVFASRRDDKTSDVLLERGIIESIAQRSQDAAEIQILVGDATQVFTAAQGALAYLGPSDSVIFAYMHQTKEIIRIATIDVRIPGRVAQVGGWKRAGKPGSSDRFWRGLLTRKDLHAQVWFGTLLPGLWGALSVGILGLSTWDWGWPGWIFLFPLPGIWIILFFIASSISDDWESMAKMELDVGYVQEVERWNRHFSDDGKIPNQSIMIADKAARDGVNHRKYHYEGQKLFAVFVGDMVMLSTGGNGRILDLRNESHPSWPLPGATTRIRAEELAQQRAEELAQQRAEELERQWAEKVAKRLKGKNGLYCCPCCGYATLKEVGRYDICLICYWEDDGQDDPEADEDWGWPNEESLTQARMKFLTGDVSYPTNRKLFRPPRVT